MEPDASRYMPIHMFFTVRCRYISIQTIPLSKYCIYYNSKYIGASKNNGTLKWMVKIRENPMKHGMIWGGKNPYFWFNTHIYLQKTMEFLKIGSFPQVSG